MATIIEIVMPPVSVFQNAVFRCLGEHLTATIDRATPSIVSGVRDEVKKVLESSVAYASLNTGDLWHIMGLEAPSKATQAIVDAVVNSVTLTNLGVRVAGSDLRGGLRITVLKADYSEVLGLKESSFSSENGHRVPWLDWLLTGGTKELISDYTYLGKPLPDYSRTGIGIMVRSRRGWSMPSEWAGTSADNWITRGLETLEPAMALILQSAIERNL